jgi:hypothetical protein
VFSEIIFEPAAAAATSIKQHAYAASNSSQARRTGHEQHGALIFRTIGLPGRIDIGRSVWITKVKPLDNKQDYRDTIQKEQRQ